MPERSIAFDLQLGEGRNLHTGKWRAGWHALRRAGNHWAALAGLGGIIQIDRRGIILGFVPIPNGDTATTNFVFGGANNQYIYLEGATTGTFWRFKAPYPGLFEPVRDRYRW
jgi:sugar lactone lactonase YvrE